MALAAGMKSFFKNSVLPIRRLANKPRAVVNPSLNIERYFLAKTGREKCQLFISLLMVLKVLNISNTS